MLAKREDLTEAEEEPEPWSFVRRAVMGMELGRTSLSLIQRSFLVQSHDETRIRAFLSSEYPTIDFARMDLPFYPLTHATPHSLGYSLELGQKVVEVTNDCDLLK